MNGTFKRFTRKPETNDDIWQEHVQHFFFEIQDIYMKTWNDEMHDRESPVIAVLSYGNMQGPS